ncbi:hypothetical protein [Streptomyces sp. Tue6028]|uniref:hypothetical protein n=1 Tax=Streptomyces sp. Tue6028 TaxID=2036037 RepID=UPI003EB70ED3
MATNLTSESKYVNDGFSWTGRARLCAAIVGRLTLNGTVTEPGTGVYRFASAPARAEEPAKPGCPRRATLPEPAAMPLREI